jgi:hypothetical protein
MNSVVVSRSQWLSASFKFQDDVEEFFRHIWPYIEKEFFNFKLNKKILYKGFVIGYEHPYLKVSIIIMKCLNKYFNIDFRSLGFY